VARGSSINQTGGIGYRYEDYVGAYLLAAAVLGVEPRAGLEPAERLDFQVNAAGWVLDDLLYTARDGSRLALSVKSSPQFTSGGATPDFVHDAWSELCGVGETKFEESRDLLGMAAPAPDVAVGKCLAELIRWSIAQEPSVLEARIGAEGAVSATHRALWHSFVCPADLADGLEGDECSPARLLRRLRFIDLDLLAPGSAAQAQAQLWCGLALAEPLNREDLWNVLLRLVAEMRVAGGFIEVDALSDELKDFEFAERLDFRGDWERLRQISDRAKRQVRETIGGISVTREEEIARIDSVAASSSAVAVIGPSGCGKTVIARQWLEAVLDDEVLWLGGAELLRLELGTAGLRHEIDAVIATAPGPLTVVIDGLDRQFEEAPFNLTARLIEHGEARDVRVVITCQEQEFSRVSNELRSLNAEVTWEPVSVGPFNAQQLAQVLRELPELSELSGKSRLGGILRRPKVLDMFAGSISAHNAPGEPPSEDDETAVARWFWELALGIGPERQRRAAALLELAREQADRLHSSIPLDELGDLAPIDELVRDGILVVTDGRVSFAHDLYGDWSRYQVLLAHRDDLAGYLADRAGSPLWHRSIRLYALGLLDGDACRWAQELRALGGEAPGSIHDLFLDALIFAADPDAAIEAAWGLLVADEGRLLNRFLSRFRYTATVPDPYLMSVFQGAGADVAVVAAASNRVPYWPFWPPVVSALVRHGAEVVKLADVELAETFDLWLRRGPAENVLRPGCAALVLAGAEQILAQAAEPRTYVSGELLAPHMRAAMAAVREEPERLRALVSAFTDPEPISAAPEGAIGRTPEAQRLVGFDPFDEDDDELPLLGAGALSAFRELCLDTDALIPVIEADPGLAAELIAAAIIPRRWRGPRRRHHPLDDYGVLDFHKWSSPLWLRGPFLQFLRAAPDRAIAMIVEVTNEATDRYLQALEGEVQELLPPITIEIEGTSVEWPGNEVVYLWYRGDARAPKTVASALMALEKWFYERIEAEEDIGPAVEQVMAESRSLAFAGLLIAVGYRRSSLFGGPLRSLLGVSDLYRLDHLRTLQSTVQYQIGLFLEPAPMQKMIGEWHEMAHRKVDFERAAQQLLLGDPELARWMESVLAGWRDAGREEDRHLIARLDVSNWVSRTLPDGREAWEYCHPPELAKESAEAMAETEEHMFWLQFPHKMRKAIDEGEAEYGEEALDRFWAEVVEGRAMVEPPADVVRDGVISALDSRCGIAAFLLLRAGEWLRSYPEREAWCRETLLEAGSTPLRQHFMDSPEDVSDWSYDRFCADALPALWAEDPEDRRVREAVAVLATNLHHNTITRLYAAAAKRRDVLGDGFAELQSLAVVVARWKTKRILAGQASDEGAAKNAFAELAEFLERFVAAELEEIPLGLPDPPVDSGTAPSDQPLTGRRRRRRRRRRPLVDLSHVWAAWSWMPDFAEALDENERLGWLSFWQEMVRGIAAHIAEEIGSYGGGAYSYENAILLGLPERILSLSDPEESRSLWQPLFASAGAGERWVSPFLTAWFAAGLAGGTAPPRFGERWEEMLEFAIEHWPHDSGDDADACWRSLLGIGRWQTSEGWGPQFAELIAHMRRFYERWAVAHLMNPESFAAFSRFLMVEAATPLLEPGLCWLQTSRLRKGRQLSERGEEDLLSLLASVATRTPALPRSASEAGEAYRALLAAAVERHNPIALALHERIFGSESGGTSRHGAG